MFKAIFEKIFGTKAERDAKNRQPEVNAINFRFEELKSFDDETLKAETVRFKAAIADAGSENDAVRAALDGLMVDAFAVVKETCRRFQERCYSWDVVGAMTDWDMVPFDVQLIGGIVLHEGNVAEMATGEGKTLVATMPLYLNALAGRGTHLVTVNDFLARRDAMWMGPIFTWLGLSTAVLQDERVAGDPSYLVDGTIEDGVVLTPCSRKDAYSADITYGQQSLFGFDYLYDNMSIRPEDLRHRFGKMADPDENPFYFAIVDEADQLLIDEARTPLIISGPVPDSNQHQYEHVKPLVDRLVRRQVNIINGLADEGEQLWKDDEVYEAGLRLLKVQRGAPKHKRLLRLVQDADIKTQINRVEMDYIRDKRQHELDEGLLYYIEEKSHVAELTDEGRESLSPTDQDRFTLPDLAVHIQAIDDISDDSDAEKSQKKDDAHRDYAEAASRIHSLSQLIRAYGLYAKDEEYVIQDNQVVIVDEFTGRLQPGRRFSDGLHQALEAKENVKVEHDTQTTATITVQNYFRMYNGLAGMTGTAETESTELYQIYKLEVVVIPTNQPIRRPDLDDIIFRTRKEKIDALIEEVKQLNE
ncbi:MAG: preprotein translocase subunit SecA, partial [Candidatus Latescibacteria bacterium]|nr:preprotein translocase subunit SecA [Candidatus Latescibacterota bacterium]